MYKKISIIIGTLNHLEDCLQPCIESLIKYTDLSDKEVVIVSNGSTDGTKEYVKSLGESFILLDFPEPLGYAKANNEGIKVAQGEYIVLLNNDTILLEQEKDTWINMLLKPFEDSSVGITGPIKGHSAPAGKDFVIFFCVMIKKEVFNKIGLISLDYGVGGGEDTEFCIEAEKAGYKTIQVPEQHTNYDGIQVVGGFPIYHSGEKTVKDNPEWVKIFDNNSITLAKKYNNIGWLHEFLSTGHERVVVTKKDDWQWPMEPTRYKYAVDNIQGNKVLEFGCSNGFINFYIPETMDYIGVDYNAQILDYARELFPKRKFIHSDIHEFIKTMEYYDTIIAMEILEHIEDGRQVAQELKKHCDRLIITTPINEPPGYLGPHHRLFYLTPNDFPGFDEYKFINFGDGIMFDTFPTDGRIGLVVAKWSKK